MRSIRSQHNLIAVSANAAETAINTEQTLDTTMLVGLSDVINIDPRRESNADEATGKEEPDTIYDLGGQAKGQMNHPKAQPQHFAFLMGYGLGTVATAAAGTGYRHTITPIDGDVDLARSLPGFTAAQRFGKTILKRRFASMFVNSVTATFAADSWVKIMGEILGTGKHTDNVTEEVIAAAENATELTLAANAVAGSTAAERLDSVHRIRAELATGVWTEVAYSAVSAATPAVITISAPGGTATVVNYRVLYAPAETAWMTFPSRVSETPLRVYQLAVVLGGAWDGSDFNGGRTLTSEIQSIEYTLNNNLQIEFTPGASEAYAGRAFRDGRQQMLKFNREFREFILQQHQAANDTFGVHLLAQGAEYEAGHNYEVELIFPKCGVLSAPLSVNGKRLGEAGDLTVMEDDTHGSVICRVKNLVSAYAA